MTDPYRKRNLPAAPASREIADRRELGSLRREIRSHTPLASHVQPAMILGGALVLGAIALGGKGMLVAFGLAVFALIVQQPQYLLSYFRRISLHQGGFVYRQLRSRGTVLFDEVDELFLEVPSGSDQVVFTAVRLREHSGAIHNLGVMFIEPTDALAFMNALLKECSLCHLDSAKAALANGEVLELGPIAIDAGGVHLPRVVRRERRRVAWADLELVRVHDGAFRFREHNRRLTLVAVKTVPHPTLLIALLKELAVWQDEALPPVLGA